MNVAPRPWVGRSRVCFCFFTKIIFKLTIDISMRKIILEMEYFIKSMIYQMLKFFKRIASVYPEMILRPLFCFEDTKNTDLLIFNSLKQKKSIFNFLVNRNWKKLADNRKSHHPIETLFSCIESERHGWDRTWNSSDSATWQYLIVIRN